MKESAEKGISAVVEKMLKCTDQKTKRAIFLIKDTIGNKEVDGRIEIAMKALNGNKYEVVESEQDQAKNKVKEKIDQSEPDAVLGFFAPNGELTTALGAAVSESQASERICAYGYDSTPNIQSHITGGSLKGTVVQQPYYQGYWPVFYLLNQIAEQQDDVSVKYDSPLVKYDTQYSILEKNKVQEN